MNMRIPKRIMIAEPKIWKKSCLSSRKCTINDAPKPAIIAKMVSPVATPIPDKKPEVLPFVRVLFIHNRPIGPKGNEIRTPIKIPFINSNISINIL